MADTPIRREIFADEEELVREVEAEELQLDARPTSQPPGPPRGELSVSPDDLGRHTLEEATESPGRHTADNELDSDELPRPRTGERRMREMVTGGDEDLEARGDRLIADSTPSRGAGDRAARLIEADERAKERD